MSQKKFMKMTAYGLTASLVLGSMSPVFAGSAVEAKAKTPALSPKSMTVTAGSSKKLTMKNTKKKVTWSVKKGAAYVTLTNKKKLTVMVKGKKAGSAVVQGKIGKKAYTCKVTVKAKPAPTVKFTEDDVTYTVKSGVLTAVKVGKNVRTVMIPSNRGITAIGAKVFENNHYIKEVVIPEGVTEIRDSAFNECTDLKRLSLPTTLKTIGNYAFFECCALKRISGTDDSYSDEIFPRGLETIGEGAFYGCDRITQLMIPASVNSMGMYAFGACKSLAAVGFGDAIEENDPEADEQAETEPVEDIENPEGEYDTVQKRTGSLTEIPAQCFQGCEALTTVVLNEEITKIGNRAFENDSSLTVFSLPGDLQVICMRAFAETGVSAGNLPEKLVSVGTEAFGGGEGETVITLPAGVKSIETGAFYAVAVSEYKVDPANPYFDVKDGVLYSEGFTKLISYPNTKKGSTYQVDSRTKEIGEKAFSDVVEDLAGVILPNGLTTIADQAFMGSNITTINIPSTVKTIGSSAFENSTYLTGIQIPDSVTSIGDKAFSGCAKLEQLTIGKGVTKLPWCVFDACSKLKNVTIGKNIEYIDPTAFAKCAGLGSYSSLTFENGSRLKAADDGSLVSSDGKTYYCNAFLGGEPEGEDSSGEIDWSDPGDTIVPEQEEGQEQEQEPEPEPSATVTYELPEGIETVSENAFYLASDISTLVVPDSVTTMEKGSFGFGYDGLVKGAAIICGKNSPAKIYAENSDIACFDAAVVGKTLDVSEMSGNLAVGKSTSFKVPGLLSQAYYSTSNPKIATVSTAGKITAVGKGTTAIICTSGTLNRIYRVTVTNGTAVNTDLIPAVSGYQFINSSTYNSWLDAYKDYNRILTLDETDFPATRVYSSNDYTYIKGAILGEDSSYFKAKVLNVLGDDYHQYIQIAYNLGLELRQPKLHSNSVVYSGTSDVSLITDDYGKQGLRDLKNTQKTLNGKSFVYKNVTSTTVDHGVAVGFAGDSAYSTMLEFYAPKDKTPGTYISQFSAFESEKELLLDKDVNVKLLDCGYREVDPLSEFSGTSEWGPAVGIERYVKLQIVN